VPPKAAGFFARWMAPTMSRFSGSFSLVTSPGKSIVSSPLWAWYQMASVPAQKQPM
jgi:hypothetical protein